MGISLSKPKEDGNLGSIKQYELLSELGRGAFGVVYKARSKKTNDVVALKEISGDFSSFIQEVEAQRRLDHQNVVKIYDHFQHSKKFYIVSELCDCTLETLIASHGKFALHEVLPWLVQLLEALCEIHAKGLIHRDLKPPNILLKKNNAGSYDIKIGDFGLAKILQGTVHTCAQLGTPVYAAPEVLRGIKYDNTVDIWALGIIILQVSEGLPAESLSDLALLTMAFPQLAQARIVDSAKDPAVKRLVQRMVCERASAAKLLADPVLSTWKSLMDSRVEVDELVTMVTSEPERGPGGIAALASALQYGEKNPRVVGVCMMALEEVLCHDSPGIATLISAFLTVDGEVAVAQALANHNALLSAASTPLEQADAVSGIRSGLAVLVYILPRVPDVMLRKCIQAIIAAGLTTKAVQGLLDIDKQRTLELVVLLAEQNGSVGSVWAAHPLVANRIACSFDPTTMTQLDALLVAVTPHLRTDQLEQCLAAPHINSMCLAKMLCRVSHAERRSRLAPKAVSALVQQIKATTRQYKEAPSVELQRLLGLQMRALQHFMENTPARLRAALACGVCTDAVSNGTDIGATGGYFQCHTCWPANNRYGVCAACAQTCHVGHNLVPVVSIEGFFCHCSEHIQKVLNINCRVPSIDQRKPEVLAASIKLDTLNELIDKVKPWHEDCVRVHNVKVSAESGLVRIPPPSTASVGPLADKALPPLACLCSSKPLADATRFRQNATAAYFEVVVGLAPEVGAFAIGLALQACIPQRLANGEMNHTITWEAYSGLVLHHFSPYGSARSKMVAQLLPYTTGDTVGCGIMANGTVFFTKNGMLVLLKQLSIKETVYALVCSQGSAPENEPVAFVANFGHNPFQFAFYKNPEEHIRDATNSVLFSGAREAFMAASGKDVLCAALPLLLKGSPERKTCRRVLMCADPSMSMVESEYDATASSSEKPQQTYEVLVESLGLPVQLQQLEQAQAGLGAATEEPIDGPSAEYMAAALDLLVRLIRSSKSSFRIA